MGARTLRLVPDAPAPRAVGLAAARAARAAGDAPRGIAPQEGAPAIPEARRKNIQNHPCYAAGCHGKSARIHLAVAPRCNISCNFCVRDFDCVNESRPGVASTVLTPEQALARFLVARGELGNLAVVGIAGPGDPLANWPQVRRTFELIRAQDDDVVFCLSTNGLALPRHAREIIELGISHVTVTVNAVDPDVGARVYGHVLADAASGRDARDAEVAVEVAAGACGAAGGVGRRGAAGRVRALSGRAAARVLLENQLEGIRRLVAGGVMVKVNTVLVDGVNVDHVEDIARVVSGLGAACHNINPMIPVKGAVFQDVPVVGRAALDAARAQSEAYLPQIRHCRQCRADAVGQLGCDVSARIDKLVAKLEAGLAAVPGGGAQEDPAPVGAPGGVPGGGAPAQPASPGPSGGVSGADGQAGPEAAAPTATPGSREGAGRAFRIAVATESGVRVDAHFGHAGRFHVYMVDAAGPRFLEAREAEAFCHGRAGCGDYDGDVFEVLDGCDAVVCAWAGPGPRGSLEEHGIRLFDGSTPASEAMADACAGGSVEAALREAHRILAGR